MASHLSIEKIKKSRYRYANSVPTIPLTDGLATAPSGPVQRVNPGVVINK